MELYITLINGLTYTWLTGVIFSLLMGVRITPFITDDGTHLVRIPSLPLTPTHLLPQRSRPRQRHRLNRCLKKVDRRWEVEGSPTFKGSMGMVYLPLQISGFFFTVHKLLIGLKQHDDPWEWHFFCLPTIGKLVFW